MRGEVFREVVTRRTRYDLARAEERAHILAGLRKAVEHLDLVIRLIRAADSPDGAGHYVRKHNPAISFTGISGSPARCANIQPLAAFDPAAELVFLLGRYRSFGLVTAALSK